MNEAIVGFIGVIIGSSISWVQTWWLARQERIRNANYLAIRVVHSLRRYLYQCWLVTEDDGLSQGQRDQEGYLVPQAQDPGPIAYPEDIDWKTISPKLTYKLLSLQTQAEEAARAISAAIEFSSGPPDYEEIFEERYLQYARLGLTVIALEKELCDAYNIPEDISWEDWNPLDSFHNAIKKVEEVQIRRAESHRDLMNSIKKK